MLVFLENCSIPDYNTLSCTITAGFTDANGNTTFQSVQRTLVYVASTDPITDDATLGVRGSTTACGASPLQIGLGAN